MSGLRLTIVLICSLFVLLPSRAAESIRPAVPADAEHALHSEPHEELTLHPIVIAQPFGFPITNSMLVTWIVAAALIIFAQIATRNIQQVPSGAQNFWEWLVESLYNLLEGIIGRDLVKKTFWFFATIFIFILFANWFGLIPGVGTIGWDIKHADGTTGFLPWFRGANADLNMTFAMALIFFVLWVVWALQANGFGGFITHLFGAKGATTGLLKALMVVVFLLVGVLEVVSILFRPISLSFRLFGNAYAGESMLDAMSKLVPGWIGSIIVPLPFYALELIVGAAQALVFMLLTAVFTLLICQHPDAGQGSHGAKHPTH